MKRVIHYVLAAVGLAVLLSSCGSGVSKPATEERTPTELLTGSWYAMEVEIDNNGNRETNKVVLTLTPDRYIYHKTEYGSDGEIELGETTDWSGEWEADDTTITTTTVWWIPEEHRVSEEERYSDPISYEKDYYFTDNGDTLYVHRWNRVDTRHYERFTRHPGLGDVSGTYVHEWEYNDGDDHVQARLTYELTSDSLVETVHVDRNGNPWDSWRLAGDVVYDRSNCYMFVTVTDFERTFDGESVSDREREQYVGHTLRFAYAPTAESDRILISPFGNELSYDPETNTWNDREDYPYGDYWVFAQRQ